MYIHILYPISDLQSPATMLVLQNYQTSQVSHQSLMRTLIDKDMLNKTTGSGKSGCVAEARNETLVSVTVLVAINKPIRT